MFMTFEEFQKKFNVPDEHPKQVDDLKELCLQYVSRDIQYGGDEKTQYRRYYNSMTMYYDFLHRTMEEQNKSGGFFDRGGYIHQAAHHGYHYFIKEHISGLQVNQKNNQKMTALHVCAVQGHLHTLQTLLDKEANPKEENLRGQTPLHCALLFPANCSSEMMARKIDTFNTLAQVTPPTLLLKPDIEGNTVLHTMATHGLIGLISPLLEAQPRLALIPNLQGYFPIHIAFFNDQKEVVERLLDIPDVAAITDPHDSGILHYAVLYGDASVVEKCCKSVPDIHSCNDSGDTAFDLAFQQNNQEKMHILQQHGAKIRAPLI